MLHIICRFNCLVNEILRIKQKQNDKKTDYFYFILVGPFPKLEPKSKKN